MSLKYLTSCKDTHNLGLWLTLWVKHTVHYSVVTHLVTQMRPHICNSSI